MDATIAVMRLYKLDSITVDRDFLGNKAVECKAFFTVNEFQKNPLTTGDRIVVSLSNGKKYSAYLLAIEKNRKGNVYESKLVLQRFFNIA